MAIREQLFRENLYIEHLEEAAFLYETRLTWLTDEEVGWHDLEDIDSRMEAHVDALLAGGTLALQVCLQQLKAAEFGTLHIIVRAFCRYKSINYLAKVWVGFDFDDSEKVRAVADALKWECPAEWHPHLLKTFVQGRSEMFSMLLPSVAGFGRDASKVLVPALPLAKSQDVKTLLWAISKTTNKYDTTVASILNGYLTDGDVNVREQAVHGLLRTGDKRGIEYLRNHAAEHPCLLAISGDAADITQILELAEKGLADENCLVALGLAGDLRAIHPLMGYLKHPDWSSTAALALNLLSGANLYEDVHVVDDIAEDELFPEEVDDYKKGNLPKNINGQPYGDEVTQLQVDRDLWSDWFGNNQNKFIGGLRYRNGKPISPIEAVNTLIDTRTPYRIRQWVYEEMVIRYGLELPFDADELIVRQQLALNAIYCWAGQVQSEFSDGGWYLFGKPC